jgi:cytochrome c-type protein NapC
MFKSIRNKINKFSAALMLVVGLVLGVVFVVAFHNTLEWTNTEGFCISCHEMKNTSYKEYSDTVHFVNRTGVRTICADCHVPKAFFPKMARKIGAWKDVYHHFLGTIDTKEKFEDYRLTMAMNVWRRMKENGSATCRGCHDFNDMDFDEQDSRAVKRHTQAKEGGKTCIDCHKGIAHDLPYGWKDVAVKAGLHE